MTSGLYVCHTGAKEVSFAMQDRIFLELFVVEAVGL